MSRFRCRHYYATPMPLHYYAPLLIRRSCLELPLRCSPAIFHYFDTMPCRHCRRWLFDAAMPAAAFRRRRYAAAAAEMMPAFRYAFDAFAILLPPRQMPPAAEMPPR